MPRGELRVPPRLPRLTPPVPSRFAWLTVLIMEFVTYILVAWAAARRASDAMPSASPASSEAMTNKCSPLLNL